MLEAATQQYWLTVTAAFLACEALYHASHFCINKTATSLKATDRATLALLLDAGLDLVMDRCLKVEHARFHGGLHLAGFDTGVIDSRRS